MTGDYFPRFQEIVIPLLRRALPPEVQVVSWVPDVDHRDYPIINVRRLGGPRERNKPFHLDKPVIEMTVYHHEGLPEAEELYTRALDALFTAKQNQTVVDRGYLTFVNETMGMTQFGSLFQDTYRVQGLIQLGIRPLER